jgi:hypothetical protein
MGEVLRGTSNDHPAFWATRQAGFSDGLALTIIPNGYSPEKREFVEGKCYAS